MSEPFIAEIKIFAGNFAPRGYAFCNGQLLPVAQNTALFSLVGTTYGGDGRTTLGLPNLQGRAAMHPGRGPGLTSRRLGQKGGETQVTLTTVQIPQHTHPINVGVDPGDLNAPTTSRSLTRSGGGFAYLQPPDSNLSAMSSETMPGSAGGGQAHNNLQPYLAMNFIIALVGAYPSRG